MRISNLSNKSGNPTSSDYLVLDDGTTVTKIDYNKLAKAIIENYAASTLAGSAQSVKAAIDSLNSKSKGTLTGEHISSTLTYQKCGNMCTVKINALKDLAGETETELGTLPTGYRPYDSPVQFAVGTPSSSGFSRTIRITINVGGAITAYLYGTTALSGAINVRGCVTFPT